MSKTGVIFVNIGTPRTPCKQDVKRYLAEFLSDRRVLDIPYIARKLLVHWVILPFRSTKTSNAYKSIWSSGFSPLMRYSESFLEKAKISIGNEYELALGMRYGDPSIKSALNKLKGCNKIILFPLYPQYASSSTGSAVESFVSLLKVQWNIPQIKIAAPFFDHEGYIRSFASIIEKSRRVHRWQHLVVSYHGLPLNHVKKSLCTQVTNCSKGQECPVYGVDSSFCYRFQCYQTSRLLADELKMSRDDYSVSFQSSFGRQQWIQPYTLEVLERLRKSGIKRIGVVCPSFVVDCLETFEEIGTIEKKKWNSKGGESFTLISSLNDHSIWVKSVCEIIQSM